MYDFDLGKGGLADIQSKVLGCKIEIARVLARQEGWHLHSDPLTELNKLIEELRDTPPIIYNKSDTPNNDAAERLKSWFLSLIDQPIEVTQTSSNFSGFSIDESTRCLLDQVRTKRFAQATVEATDHLVATHGAINVIDAGCGAIPILGVTAALQNPNVKVTFLESNPDAAHIAQIIIEKLGIGERCKVLNEDASKFKPSESAHLLISETMHSGLINEPIVHIMENLVPHLIPNGIIIPSEITVKAGVFPLSQYTGASSWIKTDRVTAEVVAPTWLKSIVYTPGQHLTDISFEIAAESLQGCAGEPLIVVVSADTKVGQYRIEGYDSLISMPVLVGADSSGSPLFVRPDQVDGGAKVEIRYPAGGSARGIIS